MLSCLDKHGMENTAAFVVRYFGGIKLGAGGLIRAYSSSVSEAIKQADLVEDRMFNQYTITLNYETANRIDYLLNKECEEVETEYWKAITVVKNAEGTTFTFSGLDDGNYRLTETKTPAGYNTIDPIEFTITAEHDVLSDSPALKSLSGNATTGEITFTSNTTEGSLSADVVNKAGATLPETGGIGTTIFYVLGSVLLVGAAVLLITKKRMSAQK